MADFPTDPISRLYPVCAACSKPIRSPILAVVRDGQVVHTTCAARELGFRLLDGAERLRQAKARAARSVGRAARLLDDARGPHRTGPPGPDPPGTPPRPAPVCAVCSTPIPRGSPLVVRDGAFCHWACAE
jgi:hypothetical protein